MTLPTLKLELDTTGVSPANKREYEPHLVPTRNTRVFKPNFGPFFTKSLKVWSIQNGTRVPLVPKGDFTCVEFFEKTTQRLATEVCAAILIHRPDLPDQFEITYQALGGFQNIDFEGMAIAVRDLYAAGNTVDWKDILDKPTAFPPSAHLHDSADLYGLEYLRDELDNLLPAIATSNDYVEILLLKEVLKSRTQVITGFRNYLAQVEAHLLDKTNSHGLTKGQINLGSVENRHFYPVTVNSAVVQPYASPRTTFNLIKAAVLGDILKHIDDHNNPHQVTQTQIGLPLVMNYSLGTVQDILTGTLTTAYTTPALVSGAVPQLLGGILGHIARTDNPHQVTALQLAVQLISNYPFAVATEVALGVTEERFMAPADVTTVLNNMVSDITPARQAHYTNVDDPHDTTALQVGLDKVANYDLATAATIQFGVVDDLYVTPFILKDSLTSYYSGKLNKSTIDNAGGTVPLDANRMIPARLLTNSPDYNKFSVKAFAAGTPTLDKQVLSYLFNRSVSFTGGMVDSQFRAGVGPVNSAVVVEVLKGDARLALITFRPSADVGLEASKYGVLIPAGSVSQFLIGDVMTLRVVKTDPAVKDIAFHFVGTLDISQSSNPSGLATLLPSTTARPSPFVVFMAGRDDSNVGVNSRNKYTINTATASATTALTNPRSYAAAYGSSWRGWLLGGKLADNTVVATTEQYVYATDVNSPSGQTIGTARYSAIGFSDEVTGFVTGGLTTSDTFSNLTHRQQFATEGISITTSLGLSMARAMTVGNTRSAYIRGGSTILLDFDGSTYYGKFSYSTQALAVVSTASTLSRFNAAGVGNDTVGVIAGGTNGGNPLTTVQRLSYATDALSAGTALSDARTASAAGGNSALGVFSGGARSTGIPVDTATIYAFSTDTTTTGTVLSAARQNHAALSSSPGWR